MPERFRVAVIGHTGRGNYGHGMDTVWLDFPDCELVAVSDPDEGGRGEAQKRLGVARGYSDYRRMLEEIRPDIVAIGPRWIDQHLEMCLAAIERGCHIFIEKPFCRSLEEADKIVDACERKHIQLAIAFPARYSPRVHAVKRLLAEGAIGRVIELHGRGKEDPRGGGEDLWVLGTHVLNAMAFLAGFPAWCYATVLQDGGLSGKEDIVEGPEGIGPLLGDTVQAVYGMPGGVTAHFHSVRNAGLKASRFGIRIHGAEGVVEMEMGAMPKVRVLRNPRWSTANGEGKWDEVSSGGIGVSEPLTDPLVTTYNGLAVKNFLEAIQTGGQPQANMYEARNTIEMIAAVFESHRLGARVSLPLENRSNPLELMKR
ncbi:MAG: Gfo/Idh/MocA family oxidoreductase [Candidatus Omnitrophica bacterium]|nr:Gfo/Idh/MocA family oxidoreductase [Candidatus Omnitrophota bacterium]